MTKIEEHTANVIFDTIKRWCDIDEEQREDFVLGVTGECREYRFQGNLGFGGKFYNDHMWRISCYPEDESNDVKFLIAGVNEFLKGLNLFVYRSYK